MGLMETTITGPVAVIGDVHGQVEQLGEVLRQLRELPDFEDRWVIFIGDLVDRGPDPKGAIDAVLDLAAEHQRTTAISGNHELAMAAALDLIDVPAYADWSDRWLDHYGADQTFQSYGVESRDLNELRAALPDSHAEYLADLPWCIDHPEYFFVHAGLDPIVSFELQRDILLARDFTLRRPQWLCSKSLTFQPPPYDCRKIVVSGHVRVPQVTFGDRRLLIDTSGGRGGILSCVLLPENRIIQAAAVECSQAGMSQGS